MRKILLSFSILALIFFYQAQTQKAHSNASNPPAGMTGQEGTTCASGGCHTGGAAGEGVFGQDVIVGIFNSEGITSNQYVPGEQYEIVVSFLADYEKYGFAMSSDGSDDEFIAGSNTAIDNTGSAAQIEHSGSDETGSWTFNWMAPTTDEGDVTLYFGGIGANGNGNNNGDFGLAGTLTLTPDAPEAPCAVGPIASVSANSVCVGESIFAFGDFEDGSVPFNWTVSPATANVVGNEISFPDNGCAVTTYEVTLVPIACEDGTEVVAGAAATTTVTVYPNAEEFIEVVEEGSCTTEITLSSECSGALAISGTATQTAEAGTNGIHTYIVMQADGSTSCSATIDVAYDCASTGNEIVSTKPSIITFPQPANDILNISLQGLGNDVAIVNLVDLSGKVMKQETIQNTGLDYAISTAELPAGVYLLNLSTNATVVSSKVVVSH